MLSSSEQRPLPECDGDHGEEHTKKEEGERRKKGVGFVGMLEEKAELLVEGVAFCGGRGVGGGEESEKDGELVATSGGFLGEGLKQPTGGGECVVEVLVGKESEFPIAFVEGDLSESQESVDGAFDVTGAGCVPSDRVTVGADSRAKGLFLECSFGAVEGRTCAEVAFEVEGTENETAEQGEEGEEALERAHRHHMSLSFPPFSPCLGCVRLCVRGGLLSSTR